MPILALKRGVTIYEGPLTERKSKRESLREKVNERKSMRESQ